MAGGKPSLGAAVGPTFGRRPSLAFSGSLSWLSELMSDRHVRLLAGLLAGLLSTILLQPLEVLKTRLQGRGSGEPRTYRAMLTQVLNEGGVCSLWAGAIASVVRLAGVLMSISNFMLCPAHC